MSVKEAIKKVREKYFAYKEKLMLSDPGSEDQLQDAKLQGIVIGLEIAAKALEQGSERN